MSGTIWKIDIHAKTATPIAAGIGRPRGIAVLPTGQIVAADYMHQVLQLVDPSTGKVQLLAGAWDEEGCIDALGGAARFATPYGVVVVNGQIVVADYGNHRLRKVGLDGRVSTLAGDGVPGFADGALATARFNKPQGLAATAGGDIYVTDLDNFRVPPDLRRYHRDDRRQRQRRLRRQRRPPRGAVLRPRRPERYPGRRHGIRRRRWPR